MTIQAGHKIGIVGRTGAGKSTISMAVTRIVELCGGKIEIDGVDISKIDIEDLRSSITMIPQDPIMFCSSLRFNLDPFSEHSDERILELCKKGGLEYLLEGTSKQELEDKEKEEKKAAEAKAEKELAKPVLTALPSFERRASDPRAADSTPAKEPETKSDEKKDDEKKEEKDKGLDFKVKEEGKNLSIGEKQLLCIIRAVLRCNKIVILDEATANIDVITEESIQKLISEEFAGATVLCIAHRLNTIIKSDKVLVLENGCLAEYDTPANLMADSKSKFSIMIKDKKREAKD